MIGWIIRRNDARARYWLLVLAFLPALLHRVVWGAVNRPAALLAPMFYWRFLFIYSGFLAEARRELQGPG